MGVLSPMLEGPLSSRAAQAIQGVIQQRKSQGDSRVTYFEFEAQSSTHGYGCAWHPSITTHRIMSARLTAELRRLLRW